jgi:uncharacterized protein (DUF885 family)
VIDRRQFVTAAGALVAAAVSECLWAQPAAAGSAPASAADATARLDALFDAFVDERLRKSPEEVTNLGLDNGKYAAAKSQLDDQSLARERAFKQENAGRLRRLQAFGRAQLQGADLANYDTVMFTLETINRTVPFDFGSLTRPYVVSQLTGSYQSVPTFLDRAHKITNKEDADAYLARLRAFAVVLDQETERVHHDAGEKVVPPDFLIDRTLEQMKAFRGTAPAESILVTSVARRAGKAGVSGDYGAKATQIVTAEIYPALDRQAKALADLRPGAVHTAGVARLPQGAALYKVALRQGTTTDMTAEEVHQLGREQAKDLTARMDALLRAQGKTSGTAAERAEALAKDPKYIYPNTDPGRQQILDYCNGLIKALQPHLPKFFRIMPKAAVEVRRVPPYIEAGAPGGYYEAPPLDLSRPGSFFINLRDTSEWSRWKLPTLIYHESEPGHHFQIALARELPALPLIRKTGGGFPANSEGWALYAEQLADEMGLYDDDVLGRIGMLQSALFRAARCVVDTGLHAKGWSREQAIDYMVETTGDNRSSMTTEVERYCTWPGQATSYKVGQTRWLKLRAEAQRRLGSRYDIRDFHDVGLKAGTMPLSVLEGVYDRWLKGQGV